MSQEWIAWDIESMMRKSVELDIDILSRTFLYPEHFRSAEWRKEPRPIMLSPYISPAQISARVKENMRTFIRGVVGNQVARWPGYSCTLWNAQTGMPILVKAASSHWEKSDSEIWVFHDPSRTPPLWVPGFLSVLAIYFGISDEEEMKRGIMDMAARLTADIWRPIGQRFVLQTLEGREVSRVAIHNETRVVVAEYPSAEPDTPSIWRTMAGEEVDITTDPEKWDFITITE